MPEILAATHNKHKVAEFQKMLDETGLDVTILSLDRFPDTPELIEDGSTFEENSAMKARQASGHTGTTAFADDSGLAVHALDGAPGIHSARYAGENATDADRIRKLLREMESVTERTACFVCVITIAHKGEIIASFRGEVAGQIAMAPAGDGGFGYDPVFIPDGYDRTFAELGAGIKDQISHRARAFEKAMAFIRQNMDPVSGGFQWS